MCAMPCNFNTSPIRASIHFQEKTESYALKSHLPRQILPGDPAEMHYAPPDPSTRGLSPGELKCS
jgi:hypothetical protein